MSLLSLSLSSFIYQAQVLSTSILSYLIESLGLRYQLYVDDISIHSSSSEIVCVPDPASRYLTFLLRWPIETLKLCLMLSLLSVKVLLLRLSTSHLGVSTLLSPSAHIQFGRNFYMEFHHSSPPHCCNIGPGQHNLLSRFDLKTPS